MPGQGIKFRIITLERVVYEDEVERVTVPTEAGIVTILPRHAPLVSILSPGEIRIRKEGQTVAMAVSTGFLEIERDSKVSVLADTAERAEELDIERVKEAKARVEKMMKEKQDREDVDFARLQAALDREMARLKVAEKYMKR